jgi:hypothetical protein
MERRKSERKKEIKKERKEGREDEGSNERNFHYINAVPRSVGYTPRLFSHICQLRFHCAGSSPERSGFRSG